MNVYLPMTVCMFIKWVGTELFCGRGQIYWFCDRSLDTKSICSKLFKQQNKRKGHSLS